MKRHTTAQKYIVLYGEIDLVLQIKLEECLHAVAEV
jgi:hypothetical protein